MAREAVTCTLTQPGCGTLVRWLGETGFRRVTPTHWGGRFAAVK